MDSFELLKKAIVFAEEKHRGQKDDEGLDYFTVHVSHVGYTVNNFSYDDEVVAAAFLHDTIEDELVAEFNKRIADLVMDWLRYGCC